MTGNHGQDFGRYFSSFPEKRKCLFGSCLVSCDDDASGDDDVTSDLRESVIDMEFRYSSD